MIELKVSNTSLTRSIAGALHAECQKGEAVALMAMGTAPIATAMKAVVMANGFAATQGKTYSVVPSWVVKEDEGKELKVMVLRIVQKDLGT